MVGLSSSLSFTSSLLCVALSTKQSSEYMLVKLTNAHVKRNFDLPLKFYMRNVKCLGEITKIDLIVLNLRLYTRVIP